MQPGPGKACDDDATGHGPDDHRAPPGSTAVVQRRFPGSHGLKRAVRRAPCGRHLLAAISATPVYSGPWSRSHPPARQRPIRTSGESSALGAAVAGANVICCGTRARALHRRSGSTSVCCAKCSHHGRATSLLRPYGEVPGGAGCLPRQRQPAEQGFGIHRAASRAGSEPDHKGKLGRMMPLGS